MASQFWQEQRRLQLAFIREQQRRCREIVVAAAKEFSVLHPDLQPVTCEMGIREPGWRIFSPLPTWRWRRLWEEGAEGRVYCIDLVLTGRRKGIYLRHYVCPEAGFAPSPSQGDIFPDGLGHIESHSYPVEMVLNALEGVWEYSEANLAVAFRPSP